MGLYSIGFFKVESSKKVRKAWSKSPLSNEEVPDVGEYHAYFDFIRESLLVEISLLWNKSP
jgi:hypothetical protein